MKSPGIRPLSPNTESPLADMIYVPTDEGWLYVALVLDLYARKLVGWAMSATMPQELTLCALDVALGWRDPDAGLVHHSDRGSQYAAHDCRNKLEARGITVSMSRKEDCWDNAPMESVNGTLKVECVHDVHFETREQAERAIMEYIGYYNTERRHSALGYVAPAEFERRWLVHEYMAQPGGASGGLAGAWSKTKTIHSTANSPSPRGTARYPSDRQFRFVASDRAGRRKIAHIALRGVHPTGTGSPSLIICCRLHPQHRSHTHHFHSPGHKQLRTWWVRFW